ncbi:MAG: diphosphate--fructose-6-phosphate 1-phosphotransferase [Eubacteriales bacterium]|jgi:6-phosphofructokinase|nr:diphosphate--fructose-6-phosphate 1-phosphotransferase [Eubacteriales bacterium]
MKRNVIVSQSGGPTPVINNSLRGVIDMCRSYDDIGTVYAGWHGVEGILTEDLLDLSSQPEEEIALLRTTPTAGSVGSCRYKLRKENAGDFERVIEVMRAHNVGYLFYIGGNDSMDTANKIAELAAGRGLDLVATGVPKTIDNDVGDSEFKLIDHTPGYGSVAKYWATAVQNANEENAGSCPSDPVLVLQAMGRKIGYIPAAARLADPHREMPLLIYMTESGLTLPEIAEDINNLLVRRGRAVVVVSEGLDVGGIGELKDSFGHTQFSASQMTVSQIVVNYLNANGLKARGSARGQVPGTDQRGNINTASVADLDEAYILGQKAVEIAVRSGGGYMSTVLREDVPYYSVRYDKVPLGLVANSERSFPAAWLNEARNDVTDDFIRYAKPLIGNDWVTVPLADGIMRFARFKPLFAEKKLPAYIPVGYRK